MATQGKVQFRTGYALEDGGVIQNAATNEAEIKLWEEYAANVDDKDISPRTVDTQDLRVGRGLSVDGESIWLADGVVQAQHLVQTENVITQQIQVGNTLITPEKMDVENLGAINANLGTITAGTLDITSGNLDIGSGSTGISIIGGTVLKMMYGGVATITMDGATGLVTCNNFNFTTSGAPGGAVQKFDTGIQVGASPTRTLGTFVRTFAMTSDPGGSYSLFPGDIWLDKSNGNRIKRWTGASWEDLQDDDVADGATAIQPGGGVVVDGDRYITDITWNSGIVVCNGNFIFDSSASGYSGARTQMTSNGIAIYNSSNQIVVQADHSNGVWVSNRSHGLGLLERYSCAYDSTEVGHLGAYSATEVVLQTVVVGGKLSLTGGSGGLDIETTGNIYIYNGSTIVNINSGTTSWFGDFNLDGNMGVASGHYIQFEAGTYDPKLDAGAAPGEGVTATGYPLGSIKLSTGGSAWLVYLDGTTAKWTRIRTFQYNP